MKSSFYFFAIRFILIDRADSADCVTTKITFESSNAIISTVGGVVGLDYVGGGAIGGVGAPGVGGGLGGGGAGEGGDGAGAAAHM